jgi:hypothetical protein
LKLKAIESSLTIVGVDCKRRQQAIVKEIGVFLYMMAKKAFP